ncbi:MAG: ATP-binding protein [Candidatus Pseudobacter hemicellulosilyticus]|uniref:ATP-binding protein n=1 Tax=Candidatus Pseudobacter hemicellulosilyticus TaxID=3121375 RepID=A0AAJ5WPL8_9BACT|nr:MAG: ATP-binding protein [Pseudobacter sp.]
MNETIRNLQDALQLSPDNVPLRLHLADVLLREGLYPEAVEQFREVLNRSYGNTRAKLGMAEAYYQQQKYSTAIIIYEELQDQLPPQATILFIKALIRENSIRQAVDLYQKVIALQPGFRDEEIDAQLRTPGQNHSPEEAGGPDSLEADAAYFLEKPTTSFSQVGGMQRIKEEIAIKIIQPLRNPDLYKAFGKKIGGGILLYGPPGCGKTYIAKATAGEINARFISIGLHDILDMWIGNSEKNLHGIFELARQNAPCVLFFDEVDAMGASRSDMKQSAMRHVINQFLSEMDGVQSDNEGVLILAATNAPWSVDPAFRRPGRFDRVLFVEPPDEKAREEILSSLLQQKPVKEVDVRKIAQQTPDYSGADLKAVVDIAVEDKLRESMSSGALQPIGTRDLQKAAKQHRPTTSEWFAAARNYALYANESGQYDDILKYLKIKK